MKNFRYVIIIFLLFLSRSGCAQYYDADGTNYSIECNPGSIMLKDGTELKGLVCYETRREVLIYKTGDVSRSLRPEDVIAFEYFDGLEQRQRVFFSLDRPASDTNQKWMFFFEMIKDFKSFAVLLRKSPVYVDNKLGIAGALQSSATGYSTPRVSKTAMTMMEVVYFMSSEGRVEPYLKFIHKIVDGTMLDRDKTKSKVVGKNILEKYFTSGEVNAMEKFAEDNDLDFEIKDDFMKILDFCYNLRESKQ